MSLVATTFLRSLVGKLLTLEITVDCEPYVDFARPSRTCIVVWDYSHRHALPSPHFPRPLLFKQAIAAPIEIGILREVIERLRRAIKARGNVVAAVVRRTTIRAPGPRLHRAGTNGDGEAENSGNAPCSGSRIR